MSEDRERIADELTQELQSLRIEDVLVNALVAVSAIGYRRLGATPDTAGDRDLDQVRLAIATMKSLAEVLESFVPAELLRDFNQAVASLQLAYVEAAAEGQTPDVAAPEPDDA